ncbi:ammonium transporter NrgA [bacterium BMS3Abin02]|nr:ammonium transporter NrgA [bacterium BMS3Abin02]
MKPVFKSWLHQRRLWVALVLLLIGLVPAGVARAADPTGASIIDLEGAPGIAAVVAVNYAWTLIAAFLVFFMQAGFALLEAGSTRMRNAGSVFMKNFIDFCMCGLAFWAFGFALMFGGSALVSGLGDGNAFVGFSGFFLSGEANDVGTAAFWFFQMVFAATAATIVSGAMAERTRLDAYMAYSFLISALIYPIYGHWVWGGGWLSTLPFGAGAKDFAGSGVVHAVGGIAALVGALMVGPRRGKFDSDGRPRSIPGHNMGYVVIGAMILFFGWFGFNPGSTLAATDLRISVIAVNTFLAGISGAIVAYYIRLVRTGKADIPVTVSGAIGGLVAITAPVAYVDPWAAVVIGGIAGALVIGVAGFLERRLHLDDPVWAVACHGGAGLWGLIAVGIFANGVYGGVSGLIVGDKSQIIAQLISVVAVVLWTAVTSAIVFGLIKVGIGLRVSEADEIIGIDATEFTQMGYVMDDIVGPS